MSATDFDATPPTHTPWGPPQGGWKKYADGIYSCETAGHGGFWISPARLAVFPSGLGDNWNGSGQWFEEDSDWALVVRAFPDCFDEAMRGYAENDRLSRIKSAERHALRRPNDIASALILPASDFLPHYSTAAMLQETIGSLTIVITREPTGEVVAIVRGYSAAQTARGAQPTIAECEATGLTLAMLDPDCHAFRCYGQREGKAA